jgi:pilus assembly protein CpaB
MARATGGRNRAALFLFVSLLAAVVATIFMWRLIRGYQDELAKIQIPEQTVQVVVAQKTLFQGETIREEHVALQDVPPDFIPETVFFNLDEVIGRVPRERVLIDEYIRDERLADPEAGVGLNAIIPRGMRAVSMNITDASAVSGFLNPGNYVDVLVTIKPRGSIRSQKPKTITLLQAVYVLAVDNRMGGEDSQDGKVKPSVTLALTPEQAEMVTHAKIEGAVTLTLRNDVDVTKVETHGAQNGVLIGRAENPAMSVKELIQKVQPAASDKPKGSELHIIRGGKLIKKSVGADGSTHAGSK